MKKRLNILLVLLLAVLLAVPARAADEPLALYGASVTVSDRETTVSVSLTRAVSDGTFTLSYDAGYLTLAEVSSPSPAVSVINGPASAAGVAGGANLEEGRVRVSFAFDGDGETGDVVLSCRFQIKGSPSGLSYSLTDASLHLDGEALECADIALTVPVTASFVPPPAPAVTTGDVTEEGETSTETTAVPSATVRDGEAAATVSPSMGQEMVNQAEKNDSDTVVVAPKISGDVSKAEVTVPGKTITDLAEKTDADLKVETPVGSVTLPDEALADLGKAGDVAVSVEKIEDTVSVQVSAGGETVGEITGGIKASFELKDGEVAVVVSEDGTETVVPKSLVEEDGNAYVFLNGSATVKITDNSRDFEDVDNADWFTSAVTFVSSHELFFGTSVTEFSPNEYMRRADLATVLWRLESTIKVAGSIDFTDVPDDVYYAGAVEWAGANGIINGTAPGIFEPMEDIKREDMVTMIYRYVKSLGLDNGKSAELDIFEDGQDVDPWALEAMKWAAANGIIQGDQNKAITPREKITRAEVATILERLVEYIVK